MAVLGEFSDPLAWLVVAGFLGVWVAGRYDRAVSRRVAVAAWVLFGVFWFSSIHHFAVVEKSIVEGVGTIVAVPACLSVAVLLYRGRDSLFVLSRAIAVMGVVFLPFETIPVLRQFLIETVTAHTAFLIELLGYDPDVTGGLTVGDLRIAEKQHPYWSTFVWEGPDGEPITYTIVLACTGIGSISVIAGLIAAVEAPLRRKAEAIAIVVPVIYGLNLVRNVFISVGFGAQLFQVFPEVVMSVFATDSPVMVSYFVADRVIAQSLSVVAMVAITLFAVRKVPELMTVIEDVLFVFTRREYDLREVLGGAPVRADGEGPDASGSVEE